MPPRSTWKGFLNLSLVSVAIRAFSASSEGSQVRLNQLHDECNSRIKHRKTCPQHGEISSDEIVMGYEYAKDQYVRIDLTELDKLRGDTTRAIEIKSFVQPDAISPLYYTDSNYFLLPDGAAGQKPYQLIQQAMVDLNVQAVGYGVLQRREHLVLIRPVDQLLCMTVIRHAHAVKTTAAFLDELVDVNVGNEELDLAKNLIEATTRNDFELSDYPDEYTDRLTQLIEAKVKGEEIVAAPAEQPRNVINLMEALKASVNQAKAAKTGRQSTKTAATSPRKASSQKKTATKKTAKKASPVLKASLSGKRKKKTTKKKRKGG